MSLDIMISDKLKYSKALINVKCKQQHSLILSTTYCKMSCHRVNSELKCFCRIAQTLYKIGDIQVEILV